MAGTPTDRIPLFFVVTPFLGIAAWLGIGKVELELLALVLLLVMLGNVVCAVHHAEVVALRVGEPFGGLVLALAVTVIEAGLIISLMLSGDANPTLMRDSMLATVMLVLHGIAGLAILVGGLIHRENQFRIAGANALLVVLMPMAVRGFQHSHHRGAGNNRGGDWSAQTGRPRKARCRPAIQRLIG